MNPFENKQQQHTYKFLNSSFKNNVDIKNKISNRLIREELEVMEEVD
jgi:hypothetical protein